MGIFDVFTGKSAKDAAAQNAALYQQYGRDATAALDKGLTQSVGAYAPLQELGQRYNTGGQLYFDSLGINGPEGNARARSAFQAGPGYEWAVNQATDAAARNAAKLGMANSGNTLAEIGTRAQNLANQEWGNWQGQLGGISNTGVGITGQTATGLSGLYSGDALNRSNVFGNLASGQAASNNQAAQSQMNASGNFWGGLMNLGSNFIPKPK